MSSMPLSSSKRDATEDASSSDDDDFDIQEDSEGWDDVEPDEEAIEVKDFFSAATFPSAKAMLDNCRTQHGLDFVKVTRDLALDYLGAAKLVNYIRKEALAGRKVRSIPSKEVFDKDELLQPTLPDDALLFSLDDVLQTQEPGNHAEAGTLAENSEDVNELRERLSGLQAQFEQYRAEVAKTLDQRWNDKPAEGGKAMQGAATLGELNEQWTVRDDEGRDKDYFSSYSYADIHETMLKDAVRTDAYRDFIYGNKHLFKNKVVLDVGCGTGILSMFCAKAGASKVIAVDNSEIIEKTRPIVKANNLDGIITCVKGKIEEITLPDDIDKVDIIVSEWMGYCLLFEAMLDSVLFARDRYLKPDGLMVPSHCTLHAGVLADEGLISEHFSFWQDVYGFDMTAMSEKIHDDVFMRHPGAAAIVGRTKDHLPFKVLDLHTVSIGDLDFQAPLQLSLEKAADCLDGFCVWFDTIFLTDRKRDVPEHLLRGSVPKKSVADGDVYFSTGPFTEATHWQCGLCVVEHKDGKPATLQEGQLIDGSIKFHKTKGDKRALRIKIAWDATGGSERGEQKWLLG